MKFSRSSRNLPEVSSRPMTNREARERFAEAPTDPEELSPRRWRTVPSRRTATPVSNSNQFDAEQSEDLSSLQNRLSPSDGYSRYPKRTTSLLVNLSQSPTSNQNDSESSLRVPEDLPNQVQSTPSQAAKKTPKKLSPPFSFNRHSIREPLSALKSKLWRSPIGGLFSTSPEQQDDKDVKGKQKAEPTSDSNEASYDLGYQDVIPRNPYDSARTVYHTARLPVTPTESQARFKQSSGESSQLFHDALEQPFVEQPASARIGSSARKSQVIPRKPVSERKHPMRTSSLPQRNEESTAAVDVSGEDQSPPALPAKSPLRLSRLNLGSEQEVAKKKDMTSVMHSAVDHVANDSNIGQKSARELNVKPDTLEGRIIAGLSIDATVQWPMDCVESIFVKRSNTKLKGTNYFPFWARAVKSNGRPRYLQKEIVDIVSAQRL